MSALNKEIHLSKARNYPEKTSINLLYVEDHGKQNRAAIVLFAIYLVLLGLFTRYGVIGQLQRISDMESEYNNLQSQVNTLEAQNVGYDAVRAEYSHYGNGYLNDDELAMQDRMKILDVIEDKLLPSDALQDISITGNTATLTINSEKLKNVSEIVADLESESIVSYVTVTQSTGVGSAEAAAESTDGSNDGKNVNSTMTIVFKDANADTGSTESAEASTESAEESAESATEALTEAGNE